MSSTYSFGRQEKLKSRKLINQLFSEGKSVSTHPLRLIYAKPAAQLDVSVKMGVSVSSRNFKKAVDRNRIKRLLREAYRLNKTDFVNEIEKNSNQLIAFIIYTDKVLPEFATINKKMQVILNKLIKAICEAASKNS